MPCATPQKVTKKRAWLIRCRGGHAYAVVLLPSWQGSIASGLQPRSLDSARNFWSHCLIIGHICFNGRFNPLPSSTGPFSQGFVYGMYNAAATVTSRDRCALLGGRFAQK